jgi:hypothetical protein
MLGLIFITDLIYNVPFSLKLGVSLSKGIAFIFDHVSQYYGDTTRNPRHAVHQDISIREIPIDEFASLFKVGGQLIMLYILSRDVQVAGQVLLGVLEEGSLGD